MTKPSEELRAAMPEETKPVEREGFERIFEAMREPWGLTNSDKELLGKVWSAALERAATVVQGNIANFEAFIPTLGGDPIAKERAQLVLNILIGERNAIRALKGSR